MVESTRDSRVRAHDAYVEWLVVTRLCRRLQDLEQAMEYQKQWGYVSGLRAAVRELQHVVADMKVAYDVAMAAAQESLADIFTVVTSGRPLTHEDFERHPSGQPLTDKERHM